MYNIIICIHSFLIDQLILYNIINTFFVLKRSDTFRGAEMLFKSRRGFESIINYLRKCLYDTIEAKDFPS